MGNQWLHRPRVGLALILLASVMLPVGGLIAQGLEAVLVDVKGEVEWSPAGATQWQRAGAATVIHTGDRVRTSANSAARLAYFEGSSTDLTASTGIRLEALSQEPSGNTVKLLQSGGTTQAQVQSSATTSTTYEVESPASVATAPTSTCPWVRVASDGTTLVRNYLDMPALAVQPQPVQEVIYITTWVPTPMGPRLAPQAQLVTVPKLMPVSRAPEEQPLLACPFSPAAAQPGLDPAAVTTATESQAPLIGALSIGGTVFAPEALLPPAAAHTVQGQGGGRDLSVRNTAGAEIRTVSVPPGMESQIAPGQPPSAAVPVGTFAAAAAAQAASSAAQSQAQSANAASAASTVASAAMGQAAAQQAAAANAVNQVNTLANLAALASLVNQGRQSSTPIPTPQLSPTATSTPVGIGTISPSPTGTITPSPTSTATPTSTPTPTPTTTPTLAPSTFTCVNSSIPTLSATCTFNLQVPSNAVVGSQPAGTIQTSSGPQTFSCGGITAAFTSTCIVTVPGQAFQGSPVTFTVSLVGGSVATLSGTAACNPTRPPGTIC